MAEELPWAKPPGVAFSEVTEVKSAPIDKRFQGGGVRLSLRVGTAGFAANTRAHRYRKDRD